jgi:hypothetical protein
MKRSEINRAYRDAFACFSRHQWALPPRPRWDITDFGLGNFAHFGLTLVNLATEPEYCEKLMFAREGQTTPCHAHAKKKEDIICRTGSLMLRLWPEKPLPGVSLPPFFAAKVDGESRPVGTGEAVILSAGSRITLLPGVWHLFAPHQGECIIGEVSTANDDLADNFFLDPGVGRFPGIEEDEPASVRLLGE